MNCILCGEKNIKLIGELNLASIRKLYKKLSIEISEKINEELNVFQCEHCDLIFFYPIIDEPDFFYEYLSKINGYYMEDKSEFDFALKYIKPSSEVLEIGSGECGFAKKLSRDIIYTGLEMNTEAIEKGRKLGFNISNKNIEYFANENKQEFDVIVSFQVLEHIKSPGKFLKSCVDVLKKNGRLIVSVPSADSYLRFETNNILNFPPHHFTWWTDGALKKISSLYDLQLVEIYNELLADWHIDSYLSTVIFLSLKEKYKLDINSYLDCSIKAKILRFASRNINRIITNKALKNLELRPRGHTVCAVYEKQ